MPPSETTAAPARTGTTTGEAIVSVMLPTPVVGPYDYKVPDHLALAPGDYVQVPLGRREITGVVWGPGPAMSIRPNFAQLSNGWARNPCRTGCAVS